MPTTLARASGLGARARLGSGKLQSKCHYLDQQPTTSGHFGRLKILVYCFRMHLNRILLNIVILPNAPCTESHRRLGAESRRDQLLSCLAELMKDGGGQTAPRWSSLEKATCDYFFFTEETFSKGEDHLVFFFKRDRRGDLFSHEMQPFWPTVDSPRRSSREGGPSTWRWRRREETQRATRLDPTGDRRVVLW